jgi:hypothetical protein
MSLQYISDSTGQTTGIFIPIDEWNEMKKKFRGIEQEEIDIPDWQKNIIQERIAEYRKNPLMELDAFSALDDIEKEF